MQINYGVNRVVATGKFRVTERRAESKSKNEHLNGTLEVEGDWSDSEFHTKVRDEIWDRHPGWNITGYARV